MTSRVRMSHLPSSRTSSSTPRPAAAMRAGAPIEVDLTPIAVGQDIKVFWRGKPIYIMNRTKKQIEEARSVNVSSLPDPQTDQSRVKEGHDNWLVVIGICTHLGCIPIAHEGNYDGFFCPCHGSQYNRVGEKKGGPAPRGLDTFAVTVENGLVTVDTGLVVNGVPIGTNTTGQEAEGPHCAEGGH